MRLLGSSIQFVTLASAFSFLLAFWQLFSTCLSNLSLLSQTFPNSFFLTQSILLSYQRFGCLLPLVRLIADDICRGLLSFDCCETTKRVWSNYGEIPYYFCCIVCTHIRSCAICIVSETTVLMFQEKVTQKILNKGGPKIEHQIF